jgi:hypothetical protein
VQDREVEAVSVVRDDDVVAAERAEDGPDGFEIRRVGEICLTNAVCRRGPRRDGDARLHERAPRIDDLAITHTHRCDLDDLPGFRILVRRLEVYRSEAREGRRRIGHLHDLRSLEHAERDSHRRHVILSDLQHRRIGGFAGAQHCNAEVGEHSLDGYVNAIHRLDPHRRSPHTRVTKALSERDDIGKRRGIGYLVVMLVENRAHLADATGQKLLHERRERRVLLADRGEISPVGECAANLPGVFIGSRKIRRHFRELVTQGNAVFIGPRQRLVEQRTREHYPE